MSLTNAQYDSIMHEYDVRQADRHRLIEERKKEIYEKVEGYREIDNQIASESIKAGMEALSKGTSTEYLSERIEELRRKKSLLLTNAGYSINYLDPPYKCPYCKDTKEENFDTLTYDYHTGEELTKFMEAEKAARNLVGNFETEHGNILFIGSVGTGKSFLSNCIANELIKKGYSVIYFSSASLFESISDYKFSKDKYSKENPTKDIYSCDLLVIDDLGSELTNSFVSSELFAIVNERHLRNKSTVISTNLTFKEIKDRYEPRVFSRIHLYYEICALIGNDIRNYIKRYENRK